MPPTRGRKPAVIVLAAVAAVAVVAGGGFLATRAYGYFRGSGPCPVPRARSITFDTKAGSEPTITVPATSGWERIDASDIPRHSTVLDSPTIRGIVVNTGIRDNEFTPNVVVTLEKVPGILTDNQIAALEAGRLEKAGGLINNRTTETVCGSVVYRADFATWVDPPDSGALAGMELMMVSTAPDGTRWLAAATLQTSAPEEPKYTAQRDALLKGFHVAPA